MRDNRERRIVPVEFAVLTVGYDQHGNIQHVLPPRPPLSLDLIYLCGAEDLIRFTGSGRFGYFRHVLRAQGAPVAEVLAAHVSQVAGSRADGPAWQDAAVREIISLLRDDYPTLMSVISSLNEPA